jgi:hypothetical protein
MAWFFRNVLLEPSQSKNTVYHEKRRVKIDITSKPFLKLPAQVVLSVRHSEVERDCGWVSLAREAPPTIRPLPGPCAAIGDFATHAVKSGMFAIRAPRAGTVMNTRKRNECRRIMVIS